MEFKVSTDLSVINPTEISFNKEEIKGYLSERLSVYKGLLVTDDTLAEAKKVRANIRKMETAINDEKKRVKNAFVAPYAKFESDVKEIMGMCSEVSNAIDIQIKELEQRKKTDKRNQIIEYFNGVAKANGMTEYVTFDMIEDTKWLNATVPIEEAFERIEEAVLRYAEDVHTLSGLSEDENIRNTLMTAYKHSHSIPHVVALWKQLTAPKPEPKPVVPAPVPVVNEEPKQQETMQAQETEEIREIAFKVWATNEQLAGLRAYLVTHGIKYGRA